MPKCLYDLMSETRMQSFKVKGRMVQKLRQMLNFCKSELFWLKSQGQGHKVFLA